MYNKMLGPLDGSGVAEMALPYARKIGGGLGLELILLHVCEPQKSEIKLICQGYIEHAATLLHNQLKEAQVDATGQRPLEKVIGKVVEGNPAEEIVNYAVKNEIDIILMASRGRSGVKKWMLGSVADKVLQASPVPVWLVRAPFPERIFQNEWPERNLLVPLDGSRLAESVIPHVKTMVKQFGPEKVNVILLRVYEEPSINADYPEASMQLPWKNHVNHIKEYFKKQAEKYLLGVQEKLIGAGLQASVEVLMGNPADAIISYAEKHPHLLIVMASHGYSGISRWAYGSVADKILHSAANPVFLVRAGKSD